MGLGLFSLSLTVTNIETSKTFYELLGFKQVFGDQSQNWLILENGDVKIGLFQEMFEKNSLTFNPGWGPDASPLKDFEDIRDIQKRLKAAGVAFVSEVDEDGSGPGSCILQDPDGNPVLLDQHV